MLFIPIVGGLGNQIFIVAFAKYVQASTKLEVTLCKDRERPGNRMHGQDALRDIAWTKKDLEGVELLSGVPLKLRKIDFSNKVRSAIWNRNSPNFITESDFTSRLEEKKLKLDDYLLCRGYFQSPIYQKYLQNQGLFLNLPPAEPTYWFQSQVQNLPESFTAMHLRLGDFLLKKINQALPPSYYRNALEKVSNDYVLVFSDNLEFARDFLSDVSYSKRLVFVQPPKASKAVESLFLMSLASEFISSNSTFSWWAATTGSADKLIITPRNTWITNQYHTSAHRIVVSDN